MCGCYDVADFVCFLTFFITALVALLSVQYLVVFLESFSTNAQERTSFLLFLYFWVMTLLGCMVFAGIQRRSTTLLKWPGRLLVFFLVSGVIVVTAYLWIVESTHYVGVHDVRGKTIKLLILLILLLSYYIAIHKLIITIENPSMQSIPTLDDDSDHSPAIVQDFMKRRNRNGKKSNMISRNSEDISRPINVASDGINYYVVLLESPYKNGSRFATTTTSSKSKMLMRGENGDIFRNMSDDVDKYGSCSSITEV